MDNAEYKILLKENTDQNRSYPWSIKEDTKNEDYIPLKVDRLYFTVSELRHHYSLQIHSIDTCNYLREENSLDTESTIEDEWIEGILHPGTCSDGENLKNYVTYSMFGTDRKIQNFKIHIRKNKNFDEEAKCTIGGHVGGTIYGDGLVPDQSIDDYIYLKLFLTLQQYNNIVDLIKSKRMDILEVTLWGPSGFYLSYSPAPHWSGSVYFIKILTDSKDHKVVISDSCKIFPPRLGDADFNIKFIQRHLLNPKQDLRNFNIDELFYELKEDNNNEGKKTKEYKEILEKILNRLDRIEKGLSPLWLIFGGLCGILIAQWLTH